MLVFIKVMLGIHSNMAFVCSLSVSKAFMFTCLPIFILFHEIVLSNIVLTRTIYLLGKNGGNVTCIGRPMERMSAAPSTAAETTAAVTSVSLTKTNVTTNTTVTLRNSTETIFSTSQESSGLFMLILCLPNTVRTINLAGHLIHIFHFASMSFYNHV